MAQTESSKPNRQAVIAAGIFAVVLAGAAWKAWDATQQVERLTQAAAPLVAAPVVAPAAPSAPPPPPPPAKAAVEPAAGEPLVFGQLLLARAQPMAPPLSLPTVDGGRFDLATLKGQVVFVNFWATWCPPCGKEMPSMVKLGQELTARHPGKFKMVAVSVDESVDLVKQFFKTPAQGGRLPAGVTVAIDREARQVVRPWYCKGRGACAADDVKFPESYIVDKSGRITAYVIGDMDWSEPAAKELLERLIDG
jgi:thiol-disulfide isomerase/thioredoxin